jgi:hypothetical protein
VFFYSRIKLIELYTESMSHREKAGINRIKGMLPDLIGYWRKV